MRTELEKGLTLIEIMVAIGILAIIAGFGLFVSISFFRTFSFHSEENTVVSLLQAARTQSMDNIDEVGHGVRIAGNPLRYISFECALATPACTSDTTLGGADTSKDSVTNASYNITITSPALPIDIVFGQLSGTSTAVTINMTENTKPFSISVNSEGAITW